LRGQRADLPLEPVQEAAARQGVAVHHRRAEAAAGQDPAVREVGGRQADLILICTF
jgi:hypothetical protein